jgi:D-amino-acid dehydrogenase
MSHIVVIGAGISGVTTAYALSQLGYQVTVLDKHSYPAMETSFANGGQLSACNAEVWNNTSTMLKGLKWMLRPDAPLLFNPRPSIHKYSWIFEFIANISNYRGNTIETTKLAISAREHLFSIAEKENIQFDLERRGILHFFHDQRTFESAGKVNVLLKKGGLERFAVTPEDMSSIEPTLQGSYYGGFFTPSDSTGDIHKFTRGLALACQRHGVRFLSGVSVNSIETREKGVCVHISSTVENDPVGSKTIHAMDKINATALVVCAGVGSRHIAQMLGDRVNIYPVKGYSITVHLDDAESVARAPWVSLLDESAKIVTSRLGSDRFRVAGTAEFNGYNRDIRADRIEPLVTWTRRNFKINTSRVVPWAGLRPMMPNMMPRVAKGKAPGVFYNTGHGHLGWTLSAATAAIIAKSIADTHPVV